MIKRFILIGFLSLLFMIICTKSPRKNMSFVLINLNNDDCKTLTSVYRNKSFKKERPLHPTS